jgi:glutamate racemase
MKIGFLDSGIGGVTVLKEALKFMPHEDYLYYADTANVPYGTKTREEVNRCILEAVGFMAEKGIKALVVACNTATSIAIPDLRKRYNFPVIGMEPAVKPAVEQRRDRRVLVLATPLTLKEEKYQNLVTRLDAGNIVDPLPLPGLVDFAEKFIFDDETILPYLEEELSPYDLQQYGTVVLGCTHFPFFKRHLSMLLPSHVDVIDGGLGTVNRLKSLLEDNEEGEAPKGTGRIDFYSSGEDKPDASRFLRYLEILN